MPDTETELASLNPPMLPRSERLYHRDQLRAARYAALADAEGFHEVCFALEALGLRLLGKKADLKAYCKQIGELAQHSVVLNELSEKFTGTFSKFGALFEQIRVARNDAMHTGVYARHATVAAIELCLGLEEALMKEPQFSRRFVKDFMVKSPVSVELWQPVAHARQLMLMHSFSFLPVCVGSWKLLSEVAMARYIQSSKNWAQCLAATINDASANGLRLIDAKVVELEDEIQLLLGKGDDDLSRTIWLVQDEHKRLCGVLSPFELM